MFAILVQNQRTIKKQSHKLITMHVTSNKKKGKIPRFSVKEFSILASVALLTKLLLSSADDDSLDRKL